MSFHNFLHPALALPLAFPLVLCLLLISLSMLGPTILLAQGTETITVEGQAVNGTGGGAMPSTLPISLHAIDQIAGRVATYSATTDERGRFAFNDVIPLSGGSYALVMDYEGMRYSELLESGDLSDPVELMVYEVTRDISVIRVERQAMIIADINETDQEIQALEVLSLTNTGDRTLLPELANITNPADINFLRFSLPTDAAELSVQSTLPGGDIIPMGTGFAVTAPVLPGEHEVTYTYRFSYQGDSVIFNQRLIQGADQYQVLAPVALSQIQVSPLDPQPRIDVGGTSYLVWEAGQIPPGRGVALRISQLPQPGLVSQLGQYVKGVELWVAAIPVLLAVLLGALLCWAWFRGPRMAVTGPVVTESEQVRRQSLVQAVAVLDDRFERGQVMAEDYRPRREELMAQLRQLTPPAGGLGASP